MNKIDRVLNRSARIIVLPEVTVWPKEAKVVRAPGESMSQRVMPDGSAAEPLRVYTQIFCAPGVTRDQEGTAPHGTKASDIPRIPLTESHDEVYWDIVIPKCAHVGLDLEFREAGKGKADDEVGLQKLTDDARAEHKKLTEVKPTKSQMLADMDDKTAIEVVSETDDAPSLLTWQAVEGRPRVKKAIVARLNELR